MYFRCPKCSKTFPTKKARSGHVGGAHSKIKIKPVETGDNWQRVEEPKVEPIKKYECKKVVSPMWRNRVEIWGNKKNLIFVSLAQDIQMSVDGDYIKMTFTRYGK